MPVVAAVGVNSRALWYLTRGTGLVAMLLLSLTLVLGITQAVRYARAGLPRIIVSGLHRNASLVAVAFVVVHVITAVLDTFAPVHLADAFIPFTGVYRPLWLGLGALSFDLMLAVVITSLLRDRIGLRAWRIVHWSAYASWPVAVAHGLGTGTDTKVGWVLLVYVLCVLAVIAAIGWRVATDWSPINAARRTAGLVASAAVVVGLVVFTAAGPLRTGWARRAGTPTALLGRSQSSATQQAAPAPAAASSSGSSQTGSLTAPFTATFAGQLTQSGPDAGGTVSVTIAGPLSGPVTAQLQIVLRGTAAGGGGLSLSDGTVTLGTGSGQLSGAVVQLSGPDVVATVSGAGQHLNLNIQLDIHDQSSVSGTVQATA